MAASDEPSDELDLARRALDDLAPDVGSIGFWEPVGDRGRWSLRFGLTPQGLNPAGPISPATTWHVVVDRDYPNGSIDIYPAKDGGITGTFAHQLPNDIGSADVPWRTGKVCIVDTVHGHELAAKRDEPVTAYERVGWNIGRTIGWMGRASRGELLEDGEPFEMPIFGQAHDGATIAFAEGPGSFAVWRASKATYGLADLIRIAGGEERPTFAVVSWRDLLRHDVLEPVWGDRISRAAITETAIWFRFDRLLVRPPWRAPQTLQEVRDFTAEQGLDFDALLRRATSAIQDGKRHFVLLGFPVPQIMGDTPSRYLWVAFRLGRISKRNRAKTQINGLRAETAAWMTDRRTGVLADDVPLDWVGTENWYPAELSARGRFEKGLAGSSVALIGAGAFGSQLGALLVRGGVHDLAIFDAGRFEAGNLARHELSIDDLSRFKAEALADRLNRLSPSARVVGFAVPFPPQTEDEAGAEALGRADLIIDATASDVVAQALGHLPFGRPRRFASVSFSFGAEKLYLYLADGETLPAADFAAQIAPWIKADERPAAEFPHEGTGCWSSVFPARADDVAVLAATAARQLDCRLSRPVPTPELIVYSRKDDGTISIIGRPA